MESTTFVKRSIDVRARVRLFVPLAMAALAIGCFVVIYRGPGRAVIRGHVGDVAATMLVYALLGLAWRVRPWVRATATIAIATAIELGQIFWQGDSTAAQLVVGSTFDWWDLVAYVAGVMVAIGWEMRHMRQRVDVSRCAPCDSHSSG